MLRIPDRRPGQFRMDRLAEYLADFAELLGIENKPVFVGLKDASTGLLATVPTKSRQAVWHRIQTAKLRPDSRPGRVMSRLSQRLGRDSLGFAELRDSAGQVICLFKAELPAMSDSPTIRQQGQVDGVVTGLIGADDTMHLHLRDMLSRDFTMVIRDEDLARRLLAHFRRGCLRVRIEGLWSRTETGWLPVSNRCVVHDFEELDDAPSSEVLQELANLDGNGWCDIADPMAVWRDIRGIH